VNLCVPFVAVPRCITISVSSLGGVEDVKKASLHLATVLEENRLGYSDCLVRSNSMMKMN
jgi:hypothetical protein